MAEPRKLDPHRIAAEGSVEPTGHEPHSPSRAVSGVDGLNTEHVVINMGPQHPSTHGVLRLFLELDGEEVVTAEGQVGFLHRGIEKLSEHRRFYQVPTLLDRGDYTAGVCTETAFAQCVEQLMEIEVPPKALWLRSLLHETVRLASHELAWSTLGLDAGGMGQFLYAVREREGLLDILDAITGSRMMFNYVRPGGVLNDLPPEVVPMYEKWLSTIDMYIDEYHGLLTGNEIFQMRTKGVGVLDRATALSYGVTGPVLRGSGVQWDIRKDRPYAAYPELDFEVIVEEAGDVFARNMVRMREMTVSAELLRQCLAGMPEGDHMAKVPKVLRPPAGEAWSSVESPRGEVGIHLVTDGGDSPYRMRYRPAAQYNLQVVEELLPGGMIADAAVTTGSMDIVLGEIDR